MGLPPATSVSERYLTITERIGKAAATSGRSAGSIQLVAVTKNVDFERISEAVGCGVRILGENKVQEAESKRPRLLDGPTLQHHFIGHLQTNKARKAIELFDVVQSVDSTRLAQTLDRIAAERGKKQSCFVEVKVSTEPSKSGAPIETAAELVEAFSGYKNLSLEGLMTIAPYGLPEKETRASFASMRTFFEKEKRYLGRQPVLSMGMSTDFEWAIEEGSTMVRIGTALFGERNG